MTLKTPYYTTNTQFNLPATMTQTNQDVSPTSVFANIISLRASLGWPTSKTPSPICKMQLTLPMKTQTSQSIFPTLALAKDFASSNSETSLILTAASQIYERQFASLMADIDIRLSISIILVTPIVFGSTVLAKHLILKSPSFACKKQLSLLTTRTKINRNISPTLGTASEVASRD